MKEYTIYGTPSCTYCDQAKRLLDMKGFPFTYVDSRDNLFFQRTFKDKGIRTVPQIFGTNEDGVEEHIGGFEELMKELM